MKTNCKIITAVAIAVFGGFVATLREPQSYMFIIGLLVALYPTVSGFKTNRERLGFLMLGIVLAGFELFASKTGIPYGKFSYTSIMKPLLFGLPILMVVIWPTLVLGIMQVANKILARHSVKSTFFKMLLVVILLVGLDLTNDPGAVAMGLWQFENIGPYYNIPLSNYFGWGVFAIVGFSTASALKLVPRQTHLLSVVMLSAFWTSYTLSIGLFIPGLLGILFTALLITTFDSVEAKFIK